MGESVAAERDQGADCDIINKSEGVNLNIKQRITSYFFIPFHVAVCFSSRYITSVKAQ